MNVTIVGINGGIGYELAYRFIAEGHRVQGTYRNNRPDSYLIAEGSPFPNCASVGFYQCDLTNQAHLQDAPKHLEPWDLMVFASGVMTPVGLWSDLDPFKWDEAVKVNATGPLRFLRYMFPLRRAGASVCFLAGPNLSKPTPKYSAYRAGKALLADAVKWLSAETELRAFMLAPGIVNTPIHSQSNDERGVYEQRVETTQHDEIFDCLKWCLKEPKENISGRTIHVVNDPWRAGHLRAA